MFKYLMKAAMKGPTTILQCRKKSYKKSDLPYVYYLKFNEYYKLLMKEFSIRETDAVTLLFTHQKLFDVPPKQLQEQCQLLHVYKIDQSTLLQNADLLCWNRRVLENRVAFLRDYGAKELDAAMVSRFLTVVDMPMGLFKACLHLPESEDMARRCMGLLHERPAGVTPLEPPSDDVSVREYHNQCVRWYVQWRLDIRMDDMEQMSRFMVTMKLKSLSLIKNVFDILHHEIGFTIDELKKYRALGYGSPAELRLIIDKIPDYYGTDMKKFIKSNPPLVAMEYTNVVELMNLFDEHDFSIAANKCYPPILLQRAHRVAERIARLENSPELRVLKRSAHALHMLRRPDRVAIRLSYLRLMNLRYTTVNSLTAPRFDFERFVRTGKDISKGTEIGDAFVEMLRLESKEIKRRIRKHPYWRQVDLMSIQDTVVFLLRQFAPEDLHDSIPLILYPRKRIAEALKKISNLQPSTEEERRLLDSPRYVLSLCLYEIESEHYFSGDGIWRSEEPYTSLSRRNDWSRGFDDEFQSDDEESSIDDRESTLVADSPDATSQCK